MPPTDSMEKPPPVERTGRPIAVFSNSYARLPERFFARLAPTPATKPRLIKFNESLASMRRAGCGYSCRSHRGVGCRSGNGRRGSRPYWGQVTQIKVPLIALTAHRPGPGSIVMASTPRQRLVGRRPCPIERSPLRRLPQDDVAVALARPPHRPWARPPACPQALTKAGDASSVRRDWRMTHGRRPPERN